MNSVLNAWSSGRVCLCKVMHYTRSVSDSRGPDQSRRCPLCAQGIGEYLIHNIRSKYDYTRYFLPPLRSNSPVAAVPGSSFSNQRRPTRRERQWGQRERREQEVRDRLERSIRRRKWVYRHHSYAKVRLRRNGWLRLSVDNCPTRQHVASNVHTRYRPFPTPAQFAASPDYISRATSFLRRELQVWPNLDIEVSIFNPSSFPLTRSAHLVESS